MTQDRDEPPWLTLPVVLLVSDEAVRRGVSVVATSPGGFVEAYTKASGSPGRLERRFHPSGENWRQRRNNFVARHMAQVQARRERLWDTNGNPTRRHLALAVWAYSPAPGKLVSWLLRSR